MTRSQITILFGGQLRRLSLEWAHPVPAVFLHDGLELVHFTGGHVLVKLLQFLGVLHVVVFFVIFHLVILVVVAHLLVEVGLDCGAYCLSCLDEFPWPLLVNIYS